MPMTSEKAKMLADVILSQNVYGDQIIKTLIYCAGSAGEYIDLQTGDRVQLRIIHQQLEK